MKNKLPKRLLCLAGVVAASYLIMLGLEAIPDQTLAAVARWIISMIALTVLCRLWWEEDR